MDFSRQTFKVILIIPVFICDSKEMLIYTDKNGSSSWGEEKEKRKN